MNLTEENCDMLIEQMDDFSKEWMKVVFEFQKMAVAFGEACNQLSSDNKRMTRHNRIKPYPVAKKKGKHKRW